MLSILTLGLVWTIAFWVPRFKRKFLYRYCDLNSATHFLIYNWDHEWTIVEKI